MDVTRITAKQKRIQVWGEFVENHQLSEELRVDFVDTLKLYRNLLAKCWEAGDITESDWERIVDLERQLELLHEEGRLQAF